jgi:hypothetical protein
VSKALYFNLEFGLVEYLARTTRRYLKTNCKNLDLPFVHRFPVSCCEITSLLLGKILTDEFPMKKVVFVKGTNTSKYEMHFWIEVDDLVLDITADQFENIDSFVIGVLPEIIINRFDEVEKIGIIKELERNSLATKHIGIFEQISIEIRQET